MRPLAATLLLALCLPAQRVDLAPFKLTIPSPQDGICSIVQHHITGKPLLRVIARAGVPLVSIVGATGTIPVRLNLIAWHVHGTPAPVDSICWAHFSPLIPTVEFPRESDFNDGTMGCGGVLPAGHTETVGAGMCPALGGIVAWPCDWDSSDGLRSRDVVVDSLGLRDKIGRLVAAPWTGHEWTEALFEILP